MEKDVVNQPEIWEREHPGREPSRANLAGALIGLAAVLAGAAAFQRYEGQVSDFAKPALKSDTKDVYGAKDKSYKTGDFSRDSEEVLLARMIWGEARNCTDLEKVAVAFTALNRANDGKKWNGETIREALLKKWQYSCFNENDPNRKKLMDPESYDAKSFGECLEIAGGVISGKYKDPAKATHYFNPEVVKPKWASKLKKIGKIRVGEGGRSRHEFYRED